MNKGLEAALPFLTHSNLSSISPSWGPTTPGDSNINYAAIADNPTSANRFLPSVLVKGPFTRADGTEAKPSERLLKSRFALSRLGGLGVNGINTSENTTLDDGKLAPATDATVQRDFGLIWDDANKHWNYVEHTGSTLQSSIKTLDQVANENREPNFFELLKAGILKGSLSGGIAINSMGAHLNPSYSRNSGDTVNTRPLEDYHILQIGANIIDQYNSDIFPTEIAIGGSPMLSFYGIDDLPYISRAYFTYFRLPTGYETLNPTTEAIPPTTQPSYRPWIRGWLRFDLWNPHRQTATSPSGDIRLVLEPNGNALRMQAGSTVAVPSPRRSGSSYNSSSNPQLSASQSIRGSFDKNDFRINTKFDGTPSDLQGAYDGGTHASGFVVPPFPGFWLGDLYMPHIRAESAPPVDADNPLNTPLGIGADCSASRIKLELATYSANLSSPPNAANNPELRLEIQTPTGWKTYQRILNFTPRVPNTISAGWYLTLADLEVNVGGLTPSLNNRSIVVGGYAWSFLDPRSQRFGFPSLESGYDSRSGPNDVSTVPMNVLTPDLTWGAGIPSDDLVNSDPARLFDPSYNASNAKQATHVNPKALGFLRYKSFAANNFDFGSFIPDSDATPPHQILDNTSYRDADLVQHRGDNSPTTVNDYFTDENARPVVFNRPFLSVGELGVVFRDTPWRSLDVSSSRSSDSALVEIFSIDEEPALLAGKVHPNSASAKVLLSIVRNTTEDAETTPSVLSDDKSNAIRNAVLMQRAISPFPSTASALSSIGSSVENPTTGLVKASGIGAFKDSNVLIKTKRDAIAKAFSDTSQVHTWILFADIVSQSGKYINNAFQVESEERIWKTFSVERSSAEIIATHDEKVSD